MADIFIFGGADDDKIWTGANNLDVKVYGDGNCLGGGTACHGNDNILVENGNANVEVNGGAGNDKITGGQTSVLQVLNGDAGDDKIWLANPRNRSFVTTGTPY